MKQILVSNKQQSNAVTESGLQSSWYDTVSSNYHAADYTDMKNDPIFDLNLSLTVWRLWNN